MKKTVTLLSMAVVILGVTFFAGCSKSSDPPTPTAPPAGAMQKYKESVDQKKPGGK